MPQDAPPPSLPPVPANVSSPHNLAAEMAVLGAILFDNNALQRITVNLRPQDFYNPANALIYDAVLNLNRIGRVADGVTLREYFDSNGQLLGIGGARYLADLLESAAFGPEVSDYARVIHDLSIRRELIAIGAEIVSTAQKSDLKEDATSQIETAERKLYALAERGAGSQGFVSFGSALALSIEMANNALMREGHIAGVASGLDDLDRKLGGFHRSDLIILAARPSMGKSALAMNIAVNAARKCRRVEQPGGERKTVEGAVVGVFQLEMSAEQLATRVLADISEVPSDKIRRGDLSPRDYDDIRRAAAEVEAIPLYIDDLGGISISQLAARARRLQRSHGLDLLIIDYLQLITSSGGNKSDGRVQEVSLITKSLKSLAKELQVPIIALSQLSRQVEMREDKRPQLSDLRESGSIEQDADVVLFIYREAYYLERMEPNQDDPRYTEWQDRMRSKMNVAEVIISKQRHGPIGKVEVSFNPSRVRFGNLAPEYRSNSSED